MLPKAAAAKLFWLPDVELLSLPYQPEITGPRIDHKVSRWLDDDGLSIARSEDWRDLPIIGYFGAEVRDELLNSEIFYTIKEAEVLIERWRQHYNPVS